jgi:hypothetical protein
MASCQGNPLPEIVKHTLQGTKSREAPIGTQIKLNETRADLSIHEVSSGLCGSLAIKLVLLN